MQFDPSMVNMVAVSERLAAIEGVFPDARVCKNRGDLAEWFRSASVAAGVVARSG